MLSLHKLYACAFIGNRWHSGQSSKGYLLSSWANSQLCKRGITDPYRWPMRNWPKGFQSEFRAYYRRLWKQRHSM
jgi:hypothetical protein